MLNPWNDLCAVFSSSLSFQSCEIRRRHLFLVFPKHFVVLGALAKHYASDQSGCNLSSDQAESLSCCVKQVKGNKTQPKSYEHFRHCWPFHQRYFPGNRYLFFLKIFMKLHTIWSWRSLIAG